MRMLSFFRFLFLPFFFLFATGVHASEQASWQDVEIISQYSRDVEKKQYTAIIKKISALRNPSYAESFLTAVLYKEKNICSYAIRWFARAAFQESQVLPASYSFAEISDYLKKSQERSPLYEYANLHIASCYLSLNMLSPAEDMLVKALVPASTADRQEKSPSFGQRFQEDILSLQADLYEVRGDISKAKEIYQKILQEFPYPDSLLKSSSFYFRAGEKEKGLELLFQVLEFPENDSTYIAAVTRLEARLTRTSYTDYQKVRIAEGYRILKQTKDALELWKEIDPKKLTSPQLIYYVQNYARLLIDLRNFHQAEKIVKTHLQKLSPAGQEQALEDVARRFFKARNYISILRMLPSLNQHEAAVFRLKALDKLKVGNREKEIIAFARRYPQDINAAKGFLFGVCLQKQVEKKYEESLTCYKQMIRLDSSGDKNSSRKKQLERQRNNNDEGEEFSKEDAQAYYFSGLIYEKQNNLSAARESFRMAYEKGGGGFYFLKALKKGSEKNDLFLPAIVPTKDDDKSNEKKFALKADTSMSIDARNREIRHWLSYNAGDLEKLADFFVAKSNIENYGVDSFWIDWKEKFFNFDKSTTADQRMGILYYLMGYRYTAERYFTRDTPPTTRYLLFQKIGQLTNDISLSSWAMRAYANAYNKPIDAFFLNREAALMLYPTPFREIVEDVSQKVGLDMAVIYALMKQESNYKSDVVSSAGAKGLMQVMPATATWLNKKLKIAHLNLFNPQHNILLGAVFFNDQLKRLNNDFELTAIAYNAGPGRLSEWQKAYSEHENELFYEIIPIPETYHYLRITRINYDNYKILLDNNFYTKE